VRLDACVCVCGGDSSGGVKIFGDSGDARCERSLVPGSCAWFLVVVVVCRSEGVMGIHLRSLQAVRTDDRSKMLIVDM